MLVSIFIETVVNHSNLWSISMNDNNFTVCFKKIDNGFACYFYSFSLFIKILSESVSS